MRDFALRDTQERFRETPRNLTANELRSVTNGGDTTSRSGIIKQESERAFISTEVEDNSTNSSANSSEEITRHPVLFHHKSLLIKRPTIVTQVSRFSVNEIDLQAVVDSCRHLGEEAEVWNCLYFTINLTMKELRYLEQQWLGYEPTSENNSKHSDSQQLLVLFAIDFVLNPGPGLCLSYYTFPPDFKDSIRSLCPHLLEDSAVPWRDMNVSHLTDLFISIRQCSARFIISACISNSTCILHPILFPKLRGNSYYYNQARIDDNMLMSGLGHSWCQIFEWTCRFGKATFEYDVGRYDLPKNGLPCGEVLNDVSSTADAAFKHGRWFTKPPSIGKGPLLFNDPISSLHEAFLFLFSDAIYEDNFQFETSVSFSSAWWEHNKGSLENLRARFPGFSDAEICKALVDSPGYPNELEA